jgi:hypothetical protein
VIGRRARRLKRERLKRAKLKRAKSAKKMVSLRTMSPSSQL